MAFTRSFLKSIGLNDEQTSAAMDAHIEVMNALKEQRDGYEQQAKQYKTDAEKYADAAKELNELKAGDFKAKYAQEHEAFEAYKAKVDADAANAKKQAAYRELLRDEKISERWFDAICRLTDFSGMKLGEDGKLENADELRKAIKADLSDYVVTTAARGARVDTPPKVDVSPKTKDEIMAIKDTAERQKAIAENIQLFR